MGEAGRLSELFSCCSAVVHAATAISRDFAAPGAWDANTRLRTEGTRLLLEASLSAGVDAYLQQSITLAYPEAGTAGWTRTAPSKPPRSGRRW